MQTKQKIIFLSLLLMSPLSYGQYQSSENEINEFNIYDVDSNIALAKIEKQKNKLTEAVFALERALAIDPKRMDARYLLAEIHHLLNEKASAKRQLVIIVESKSELAGKANKLLREIDYVREGKASFLMGYRLSYDTNINSGINETTVFIPSISTDLDFSQDLSEKKQVIHTFFGSGTYKYKYTESLSFFTSGTVLKSNDDLYNQQLLFFSGGAEKNVGLMTYTPKLSFYRAEYDGYDTIDYAQLSVNIERQLNKQHAVSLQTAILHSDYSTQNLRDDVRMKVRGQYKWQTNASTAAVFEFSVDNDLKKRQSYLYLDSQSRQVVAGLRKKLTPKFLLSGGVKYVDQTYQGQDTLFLTTREDKKILWESKLSWLLRSSTSINFSYSYLRNDSNIPIYDYSKNIFSVGIIERF
jgi:tetratricopeptide (TPR) repeat protein